MVKLQVKDSVHVLPDVAAHQPILDLDHTATLEDELDAMVASLKIMDTDMPDVIIQSCMAYMARCTEMSLQLSRIEGRLREAKVFRLGQLERVTDLIDFMYRGASRLIEVHRQDQDLSR